MIFVERIYNGGVGLSEKLLPSSEQITQKHMSVCVFSFEQRNFSQRIDHFCLVVQVVLSALMCRLQGNVSEKLNRRNVTGGKRAHISSVSRLFLVYRIKLIKNIIWFNLAIKIVLLEDDTVSLH